MPPLRPRTVEIILSNEQLSARQVAASLGLPVRTVEGVRGRYAHQVGSARGRGHPRDRWVCGVLARWPEAPTRYVVAVTGASAATVRRARGIFIMLIRPAVRNKNCRFTVEMSISWKKLLRCESAGRRLGS